MEKEITKKEETSPTLLQTELEQIRRDYSNPDNIDGEQNLLAEYNNLVKIKNPNKEQQNKKDEIKNKIATMYQLENGYGVISFGYQKDYQSLAQMRQKVIRDYNCKTSLELMLADSIVASYWRIIKNEIKLGRILEKEDGSWSFDQLKVNVMKELNKQIDLANRRLNMNIILLKEMKQPVLKVNVKTNNAFIGENQQFNNNVENNETK